MKLEKNPQNATNLIRKMAYKTNQKQKKSKTNTLFIFIILLFMFIPLASSLPQIQLISQTDPLELGEIQTLTIDITSNHTIIQALIEFDEQNHTLQKQAEYYVYSWIPNHKGLNEYIIHATDYINETLSETQTYTDSFVVQDTTPPEIIETQPQGILDYNLVELKAITNENSTCRYDQADLSFDSMGFTLSGEELIHTKLRSLGDGDHLFYVRCKDTEDNAGSSSEISFSIDTKAPKISKITPTGTVNHEQITLKFNTDEIANCKWGKTDQEYDNLHYIFQLTGATLHEQPLTLSQGINTYYISCEDELGHQNPTIIINIELNLPPSASISVDKNDTYKALRKGTYEVALTASEPLGQLPTLQLKYHAHIINIPLEGSQENWEGYLIIPDDIGEYVGEFLFHGKDTKGTTGNEITSGKLILLDTTAPPIPGAPRLINKDNKIEVSWEYDGEEIEHFNIYRSTTGNTDKSDFETTASDKTFLDASVIDKIGYFYRISAVDEAGNEGDLSEEKFLMTEYQNTTSKFIQDPVLLAIINNKITGLEKIVQNIEVKISELEETTDQELLEIINELELVNEQKDIKSKIQTLIGELKTFRETELTRDELIAKIDIIDTKIEQYQKSILKEVRVRNKVQTEQVPEQNLIQEAVKEYLRNKALSGEQRRIYDKKIIELQEEVRIVQEIISYETEYEFKESQRITLIKETILSTNELKGVVVQEIIPRDAVKISELNFTITPQEINNLGAVWVLSDLENSELKYNTLDKEDLNQLQTIRTVLLFEVDEFLNTLSEEELNLSNQVTGEAVKGSKQGFSLTKIVLIPLGIIIMIGLLIYYFVFLKSESAYEDELITRIDEQEKSALQKVRIPEKKQSPASLSLPESQVLMSNIQKAYQALETGNIIAARGYYTAALSYYNRINLNVKNKFQANYYLNMLYEKILRFQK